ncbi:hypothetical protein Tco_1017305 [Tanacetum coccineum]|uniref:Uncharacterized protein n=1 Tax=Tanacetum coccineum TaxID=301880 RepID=A0ABQ5FR44_9ASTR
MSIEDDGLVLYNKEILLGGNCRESDCRLSCRETVLSAGLSLTGDLYGEYFTDHLELKRRCVGGITVGRAVSACPQEDELLAESTSRYVWRKHLSNKHKVSCSYCGLGAITLDGRASEQIRDMPCVHTVRADSDRELVTCGSLEHKAEQREVRPVKSDAQGDPYYEA